jgi:hypothetical protein
MEDISDLYIKYEDHPEFNEFELDTHEQLDLILLKVEMLLFTRKREVLGHHDMGFDIEDRLWNTKISAKNIEDELYEQIRIYIPEISLYKYNVSVSLLKGSDRDIGIIEFTINDRSISTIYR